ncbi:RIO1 family protein [uncultured archaeon]|nr:RIO1 family protein [uncultured archaeon]
MPCFEKFLNENNLKSRGQISKGWTSCIYLVENYCRQRFAIKVLREKSNRKQMAKHEAENLGLANSAGVGPKLICFDLEKNIVMMEFIDGTPFCDWIAASPSKGELEKFIEALYSQARALDKIGLDHGQLAGRGKNILVRNGLPVIIDFEKASSVRKCHNVKVLDSFLFRSRESAVVKKIAGILGDLHKTLK